MEHDAAGASSDQGSADQTVHTSQALHLTDDAEPSPGATVVMRTDGSSFHLFAQQRAQSGGGADFGPVIFRCEEFPATLHGTPPEQSLSAPAAEAAVQTAAKLAALHAAGHLSTRELSLMPYLRDSLTHERAAAALALGQLIADAAQNREPIDAAPGLLEDMMELPTFQAQVAQALLKAYTARAESGIEPNWRFIGTMIHRYDDCVLAVVEDWMPRLCTAWVEAGHAMPEQFLDELAATPATASIAQAIRQRTQEGLRDRAQAAPASDYVLNPPGDLVPADPWRSIRHHAELYGAHFEQWFRESAHPGLFASNARFGAELLQRHQATEAFAAFVRSRAFLESDIQKAWTGYLELPFWPQVVAPLQERAILAMPHEVLDPGQNVVNVVKVGAFGVENYSLSPKHFLVKALASRPDVNLIQLERPISNVRIDGGTLRSPGGFVIKGERVYLAYFGEQAFPPAHYVLDFSRWTGPRSALAPDRHIALTGLGPMPHVHAMDYEHPYIGHKAALGIMAERGVAVPETLTFLARTERFPEPVRRRLEALPDTWYADGMTAAHLETRVRDFIARHGIAGGIVVKPGHLSGGDGVTMLASNDMAGIAARIAELNAQGQAAIVQRRLHVPTLVIDEAPQPWNIRMLLSRDEHGEPVIGGRIVRIGGAGGVSNTATGADSMLLEEVLALLALQHPHLAEALHDVPARIDRLARDAYRAWTAVLQEDGALREEGEDPTVYVGWDVMLDLVEDRDLVPTLVECNGIDSGCGDDATQLLQRAGASHPLHAAYHGGHLTFEQWAAAVVATGRAFRDGSGTPPNAADR